MNTNLKVSQGIRAVVFALATMAATSTFAITYTEAGDAGELFSTGQAVTNGTSTIEGTLAPNGLDVDMFNFSWGGSLVGLTTFELVVGGVANTVLTLVDSNGTILAINNNIEPGNLASLIIANLAAGSYGIAISAFNRMPTSGVGTTLTGWSGILGFGDDGDYNINILSRGPINAPIPEPEIYAMLAAGLGLMGFVARRRKQQGAVV